MDIKNKKEVIQGFISVLNLKDELVDLDKETGEKVKFNLENGIKISIVPNPNKQNDGLWEMLVYNPNPFVGAGDVMEEIDPLTVIAYMKELKKLPPEKNKYSFTASEIKVLEGMVSGYERDEADDILREVCEMFENEKVVHPRIFMSILNEKFEDVGFFPEDKSEVLSVVKHFVKKYKKEDQSIKKKIGSWLKK